MAVEFCNSNNKQTINPVYTNVDDCNNHKSVLKVQ